MVPRKPRGRWLRIDRELYNTPAFRSLDGGALKLWVDMRIEYDGSNNGNVAATLKTLKPRGWNSNGKLTRAIKELIDRGLIRRLIVGKAAHGSHIPSLYCFTDLAVQPFEKYGMKITGAPATHDYLKWSEAKKTRHPNQVHGDTRIRYGTAPESGAPTSTAIPETGAGKNGVKSLKQHAQSTISRPTTIADKRAPESGDLYIAQATEAKPNEFTRSRMRYEARAAARRRQTVKRTP